MMFTATLMAATICVRLGGMAPWLDSAVKWLKYLFEAPKCILDPLCNVSKAYKCFAFQQCHCFC